MALVLVNIIPKYIFIQGSGRILNGQNATRSYPYQISLQKMKNNEWIHRCGGAIVSPTCVLTAAHCVLYQLPEKLTILAGTNRLNDGGERYQVRKIIPNPFYGQMPGGGDDIAVLRLVEPFQFDDKIAPIKCSRAEIGGGVNCTLTGWGYTRRNPANPDEIPNDLQIINLPTLTNAECLAKGMRPTGGELCTYARPGKGSCKVSCVMCVKKVNW